MRHKNDLVPLIDYRDLLENFVKGIIHKMLLQERESYLVDNGQTKGNGFYKRNLMTSIGNYENLNVPRTRDGKYRSQFIPYHKQSSSDFEEMIHALFYAGVSTRTLSEVLEKLYGKKISHSTISKIAQVGTNEINKWRNRELLEYYHVLFIDALYFPLKRDTVEKEAIYLILGVRPEGNREILGFFIPGGKEGAYNWEEIFKSLEKRGLKKVDLFVIDDLTGLTEAISRQFKTSDIQICIVHAVKNSMHKVRVSHREEIIVDLKKIYNAANIETSKIELKNFNDKWCKIYPKVIKYWVNNFSYLTAFMKYPAEIRKYIYTNNAIERLNKEIKRRLKSMEMFQSEISAEKILYVLLKNQNEKYLSRKLINWTRYFNVS